MPFRNPPLVTGFYYHVFNRGVNKQQIFSPLRDYIRFLELIRFYQRGDLPFSFSRLVKLSIPEQQKAWKSILDHLKIVEVVAYCLMPNHFHFLLFQKTDGGISHFMANLENSYSRYYNTKYERVGHLFQGQFKAVRVTNNSQLLHLSRYIHLNPYTSFVVDSLEELEQYQWSSLLEYLEERFNLCDPTIVLNQFKSFLDYRSFVFDQAAYQRELHFIKDLLLD